MAIPGMVRMLLKAFLGRRRLEKDSGLEERPAEYAPAIIAEQLWMIKLVIALCEYVLRTGKKDMIPVGNGEDGKVNISLLIRQKFRHPLRKMQRHYSAQGWTQIQEASIAAARKQAAQQKQEQDAAEIKSRRIRQKDNDRVSKHVMGQIAAAARPSMSPKWRQRKRARKFLQCMNREQSYSRGILQRK
jgi:hypothetical protein